MNLTLKSTVVGIIALGLSGTVLSQEVTLRFQHFISPKGSVPKSFMVPWAEKIEKESAGRIKIEIYPAMQLGGKPSALYDQIRDGVIDGGWALPAYTPGRFPEAEAFELPFMTSMSAEASSKSCLGIHREIPDRAIFRYSSDCSTPAWPRCYPQKR